MSNLEEQLKIALRRQEPSPDFTARVLALAQARSESPEIRKPSWPARLAAILWLPTMRWRLVAAAVCLLVFVGIRMYRELGRVNQQASLLSDRDGSNARGGDAQGVHQASDSSVTKADVPKPQLAKDQTSTVAHRRRAETAREQIARREGERAKEQLELALYIASTKLNQAERAVTRMNQDDGERRDAQPDDRKMER